MRRSLTPALIFAGTIAATASMAVPASGPQQKTAQPVLRAATGVSTAAAIKKPAPHAAAPSAKTAVAKNKSAPRAAVALIKPTAPAVQRKVAPHKIALNTHRMRAKHVAMRRPGTTISIPMDEVRVVAFSQPVQTVYVGNPLIADITMIDSKHAFLLGKGFGATNIIALNSDGKQVVNDTVSVFGHTGNLVILHRGAAQATYACSGARCEIAPTPGDDKDYYASRTEQLANHQDGLLKAASAGR
jgi:Flp pilus assembly secretin CpaC